MLAFVHWPQTSTANSQQLDSWNAHSINFSLLFTNLIKLDDRALPSPTSRGTTDDRPLPSPAGRGNIDDRPLPSPASRGLGTIDDRPLPSPASKATDYRPLPSPASRATDDRPLPSPAGRGATDIAPPPASRGTTDDRVSTISEALLLPLELMVQPLRKRFKYHFMEDRKTNSLDKVCQCFWNGLLEF